MDDGKGMQGLTCDIHLMGPQHSCSHHGADERQSADREEEEESYPLRPRHPESLHDDEWNWEEEEIENDMENAEGDRHVIRLAALSRVCSRAHVAEPKQGPHGDAHKCVAEDYGEHEDDQTDE